MQQRSGEISLEPRSRGRVRPTGFTLVELLVTLVLAAVLLGMAVPSFRATIANNRLVTQTNDLVGALTYARSEAITRNASATVCRASTAASTNCVGSAGDWQFWIIRNAAGQVVRTGTIQTYNGGLRVTSTLANDAVTYSSDGLARTGSPAALLGTETLRVCVSTSTVDNVRRITPGRGSQLSTGKATEAC